MDRSVKIFFTKYKNIVKKINTKKDKINIAIVGKYVDLKDAYKSLDEALNHGGFGNDVEVISEWVDSTKINKKNEKIVFFAKIL